MSKLGIVRDHHLNPWDIGNYYGVVDYGVDLYVCGRGKSIDWAEIMRLYPKARPVNYSSPADVLNLELDVVDLPDAHYDFTRFFVNRHQRTMVVGWDNIPGKNQNPQSLAVLQDCWKVIARSQMAYNTLKYFDGVPAEKMTVIPGAISTSMFAPSETIDRDRDTVLYVGRLTQEKGLLTLIWAMKMLPNAKLVVIGSGEQEGFFRDWALKLDINVDWMGFVPRRDIVNFYQSAGVFVLPSIPLFSEDPYACWIEQFGQVLIEAMSCGLPVVASRSGAIPDIAGEVSSYFDPGSFDQLAGEIRGIIKMNDTSYDVLSTRTRNWAKAMFDKHEVGREIKRWYEL